MILNRYIHEGGGSPPTDIFPLGNAASSDDANSTGTWAALTAGGTISSVFVSGRGYVLQIESTTADASQGAQISVTIENGVTYEVSWDYRVLTYVSSTQASRAWIGFTTAPLHTFETDGTWRTKVETVTANSTTGIIRQYSTRFAGAGANIIQIDNMTIIEQ